MLPNLVHFCLFQADSLKKSLKGSGNGCSLDSKMQQVKELEDEVSFSHFIFHVRRHLYLIIPFLQMANVDREMAALGEERAEKSKRLNLKRMQHVSTLQQLSKFFLHIFTVFENHRKSLIQHCERSELRLHFEWTKVH